MEDVSDGYHTFSELYEHRNRLFVALMRSFPDMSWRANVHDDGSMFAGYFIAGMDLPTGSITYHLPLALWESLDFSNIRTSNRAPTYDGHSSDDVLQRLKDWDHTFGH